MIDANATNLTLSGFCQNNHNMKKNVSSGVCQLWDLMQSKMITEFKSHTAAVNIIQFHPNEYLLASGSSDRYDTTPEPALHGLSERRYFVNIVSEWQDPEGL